MVVHKAKVVWLFASGVVVRISQRGVVVHIASGVVVHRANVVWLFTRLVVWILTELKCFSQS